MKKILNIIKDSNYSFSLFDQSLVNELEQKITIKDGKPYVVCTIRDKEIVLKPEEVVRQLYLMKLIREYGYPKERFTLKDLIVKDKIPNEGKSLKSIIQEMEDEVLANAGVDVFEEVFKLIFTKLYDELQSKKDKMHLEIYLEEKLIKEDRGDYDKVKEILTKLDDSSFRVLEFRNTGQSESELKKKIQNLFNEAKAKWPGVFDEASQIQLSPSHLSICIASLQDIKLFNSKLQIVDESF